MLRRALLLKVVSWIVLSPAYAVAQPPQPLHCRADVRGFMSLAWHRLTGRARQHGTGEGLPIARWCGINSE